MKTPNIDFLRDPRLVEYFGGSFDLKADVLRAVLAAERLADVAARHGVSREAVSKQARKLRKLFPQLQVDCKRKTK